MALGLDFWQAGKPDRWHTGRQPLELPEYHMVAPLPLHRADMQLAVVNQLRWYPGSISIDAHHITMEGWALALWDPQDQLRFLVNGVDFEDLEWPLPSPDLLPLFEGVPHAEMSRFRCHHRRTEVLWPSEEKFVRFNVTTRLGEHAFSYRTAWYLADPAREAPMPQGAQIERVIGAPSAAAYRLGGASTVNRLDAYLRHRFDKSIASFDSVLDWGCGAGRLTRYLSALSDRVTGVDIDADNVAMCARSFPGATFIPIERHPPTPFSADSFTSYWASRSLPTWTKQHNMRGSRSCSVSCSPAAC